MDTVFIFGAEYLFLLVLLIAGIYFLLQPKAIKKEMIIFSSISLPLICLLAVLASHLYFNPRPFIVGNFKPLIPSSTDNGFPSDHVLLISAVASVVMYFNRRVGFVLWIIAICVGISRVYVGVHHLVDVLGSVLISLIVTFIVKTLIMSHFWQKSHILP